MRIAITRTGTSGQQLAIDVQRNHAEPVRIKAEPGSKMTLSIEGVPQTGRQNLQGRQLVLKKAGNHLLIQDGDEVLVEITDYYLTPGAVLEGTDWTFSGSADHLAVSEAQSGVVAATESLHAPDAASASGASSSPYTLTGLAGAALLLGAAVSSGGSSNGSNSNPPGQSPNEPPSGPGPGNTITTVHGTVVAGPVLGGHGLSVTLYKADGSVLAGPVAINADGSFSLQYAATYTGPALARVTDNGFGADYMDEATRSGADLDADLRAAYISIGPGDITVVVSVLTELAVRSLGLAAGDQGLSGTALGGLTGAQIDAANQQLAAAFNLGSILVNPHLAVDTQGHVDPGVDAYGGVLAAVSGLQLLHGTTRAFDLVLAASGDGNGASENALALLIGGAAQAGVLDRIAALDPAIQQVLAAAHALDTSTLDAATLHALSPAVVAALSPAQIAALPVAAVSGLSPAQIVALNTGLLEALTTAQVEAMSPAQVQALGIGQFTHTVQADSNVSVHDDDVNRRLQPDVRGDRHRRICDRRKRIGASGYERFRRRRHER